MVYDDDTGSRPSVPIRPEDRPPTKIDESRLPPKKLRDEILRLAKVKQWGAARIEAELRLNGLKDRGAPVALDVIRYVLEQSRTAPKR